MRGSLAAGVIVLALASGAAREAAAGETRTSSLSWLRMPNADACVATQALARGVEERLGRRVFVSAAEADVSVEGRIEKRADAWHAVLTLRDGKGALLGTRELDRPGATCDVMTEPLALVIAVMIDPDAKLGPKPAAEPPPAPVPVPVPVPDSPPSPPPPARDPWRFQADAYATLVSGLTPTVAPGAGVAGAVFVPNLPLGLRGYANLHLPTNAERDGARASFDLLYVGGALCPTLRGKVAVGMLCFGGQLGALRSHAETQGRAIEDTTKLVWNAVSEARLTIPLFAPVALTGGLSAVLPLLRPAFEYAPSSGAAGRDNLHKVSSFAVAADAGLGFYFP